MQHWRWHHKPVSNAAIHSLYAKRPVKAVVLPAPSGLWPHRPHAAQLGFGAQLQSAAATLHAMTPGVTITVAGFGFAALWAEWPRVLPQTADSTRCAAFDVPCALWQRPQFGVDNRPLDLQPGTMIFEQPRAQCNWPAPHDWLWRWSR